MNPLKVLVIDDDKATCHLLETVLRMENYQAASRHKVDNEDIVSVLNQETPDILILDLHLGAMDSLKFITAIRADPAWKDLRILATSALNHRQDCLDSGANDFLLKPFEWQDVMDRINQLAG